MLIDDTMLAEDDDYWDEEDDIGEYDDQPAAVSRKPTPAPLRHSSSPPLSAPAAVSAATALSNFTAIRQSNVTAKKKRGGWDDVDIGEMSIQQMDEHIELERKQQEAQQLAVQRSKQWSSVSHQDAVNAQYQAQLQRQQQQPRQQQPQQAQQSQVQRSPFFSSRGRTSFGRGGPRAGIPVVPAANVRLAGQHAGLGLSADYAGGRRLDASARASGNVALGTKRKAGELMVRLARPRHIHITTDTAQSAQRRPQLSHCPPMCAAVFNSSLVSCSSTSTARSQQSDTPQYNQQTLVGSSCHAVQLCGK